MDTTCLWLVREATHAPLIGHWVPLSSVGADSLTPWHGWPPIIMLMPPSVWPVNISQSEARLVTIWPMRGLCHRLGTPAPSHQSAVMCVLVLWRPLDIANQFYERLVLASESLSDLRFRLPMRIQPGPMAAQPQHIPGLLLVTINLETNML